MVLLVIAFISSVAALMWAAEPDTLAKRNPLLLEQQRMGQPKG